MSGVTVVTMRGKRTASALKAIGITNVRLVGMILLQAFTAGTRRGSMACIEDCACPCRGGLVAINPVGYRFHVAPAPRADNSLMSAVNKIRLEDPVAATWIMARPMFTVVVM